MREHCHAVAARDDGLRVPQPHSLVTSACMTWFERGPHLVLLCGRWCLRSGPHLHATREASEPHLRVRAAAGHPDGRSASPLLLCTGEGSLYCVFCRRGQVARRARRRSWHASARARRYGMLTPLRLRLKMLLAALCVQGAHPAGMGRGCRPDRGELPAFARPSATFLELAASSARASLQLARERTCCKVGLACLSCCCRAEEQARDDRHGVPLVPTRCRRCALVASALGERDCAPVCVGCESCGRRARARRACSGLHSPENSRAGRVCGLQARKPRNLGERRFGGL